MKCANCKKEAVWIFDDRGAANQFFCDADLPWFLRNRAKTGMLKKVAEPAAVEPVVVVEPPVVEDTDPEVKAELEQTEEPTTEEAPKKKGKKKTNVENPTDTNEAGAPDTGDSTLSEGPVSL